MEAELELETGAAGMSQYSPSGGMSQRFLDVASVASVAATAGSSNTIDTLAVTAYEVLGKPTRWYGRSQYVIVVNAPALFECAGGMRLRFRLFAPYFRQCGLDSVVHRSFRFID